MWCMAEVGPGVGSGSSGPGCVGPGVGPGVGCGVGPDVGSGVAVHQRRAYRVIHGEGGSIGR